MTSRRLHQYLRFLAVAFVICTASGRALWAQGPPQVRSPTRLRPRRAWRCSPHRPSSFQHLRNWRRLQPASTGSGISRMLRCLRRRQSSERGRLCGHSRESAKRRPRTESGGAPVRPIHSGAGNELYRRNRGRGWPELLLPQDRPPQAGADHIAGEHRRLRRSGELRASSQVSQAQTLLCKRRRLYVRHFSRGIPTMGILAASGVPSPPPRNIRIIELARNRDVICEAQSLAGKILMSKNLEAGIPEPTFRNNGTRTISAHRHGLNDNGGFSWQTQGWMSHLVVQNRLCNPLPRRGVQCVPEHALLSPLRGSYIFHFAPTACAVALFCHRFAAEITRPFQRTARIRLLTHTLQGLVCATLALSS